jgi:hypothetical protein
LLIIYYCKSVNPRQFKLEMISESVALEQPPTAADADEIELKLTPPNEINVVANTSGQMNDNRSSDVIEIRGKLGINTSQPDEALTVVGNLKLSGLLLQPSDMRIKENIQQV